MRILLVANPISGRRRGPERVRELAERLVRRAAGAGDISDGHPELLPEHRARYEAPEGEPGVVRVDTYAEPPIERVLETLRAMLHA